MGSPYFRFGAQRRYPYQWGAGQGGVMGAARSGEARELGVDELVESGLTPFSRPYPAFSHTRLHDLGSVAQFRPAGPEPVLVPLGLSDMEKKAAYVGAAALAAWWLLRGRKARR